MAQQVRQSRLFAAEDYKAVYESYVNANFQAYDFDTIRTSMIEYISNNYPESYSDWVESAEFVALLDVVAQFGHNLAFRVDLNSRNNFLSTAERQDSVFKLSEFLGYKPRRNVTPFGLLKVTSIKTNENVIGASGTTLGGDEIRFENTTTADNLDNFTTVMNALFVQSNQFGSPRRQVTENNVSTQYYNTNNVSDQIVFTFTGLAQGSSVSFNAVGLDYDIVQKKMIENTPDPSGSFSIQYKNDGQSISSNHTGFFVGFKQGQLTFKDFNITESLSGMTLDIDETNINSTDVWVQTVNADGTVNKKWTSVDNIYGQSSNYNFIEQGIRDIYSVKTREDNKISVCFADKSFGNPPKGIIRIWYRKSENLTYVLRPDDIGTKRISIDYTGADGNAYTAVLAVQLRESVTNASSSESLDDIKTNAPRIYATQDRMITADDYNSYLYTQSDNIRKIKSINRTHSGHSRFVTLNDPTGAYTNLNLFATDGKVTKTTQTKVKYATDMTPSTVFDQLLKQIIQDDELINLYFSEYRGTFDTIEDTVYRNGDSKFPFTWQQTGTTNTGYFTDSDSVIKRTGKTQNNYLKYLRVGALVKFGSALDAGTGLLETGGTVKWAKVSKIFASGLGIDGADGNPTGLTANRNFGAISLDATIPNGYKMMYIIPAYTRQFDPTERANVIEFLGNRTTFALKYDFLNLGWDIIDRDPLPSAVSTAFPTPFAYNPVDASSEDNNWTIHIAYDSTSATSKWDITTRVLRYTLESTQIDFSNITNEFQLNEQSNKKQRDRVKLQDLTRTGFPSSDFFIYGYEFDTQGDQSGIYNQNKIILSLVDNNNDDRPDDPDSFNSITVETAGAFVVGRSYTISTVGTTDFTGLGASANTVGVTFTATGAGLGTGTAYGNAQDNLRFEWTHVPADNEVVDPSFTNLIDVFVLTRYYDTAYRNWLKDTREDLVKPVPPTIDELKQSFSQQTGKKAMSDSIIYRPVNYKVLFGAKADASLQAKFRIIKVPGTRFTDNEIKDKVVEEIGKFFNIDNWDFGETFYFTELAAYVHKELAGIISSFVIVPQLSTSVFGDLFQITPLGGELLIPDVSATDIDIIDNITQSNIRAA